MLGQPLVRAKRPRQTGGRMRFLVNSCQHVCMYVCIHPIPLEDARQRLVFGLARRYGWIAHVGF